MSYLTGELCVICVRTQHIILCQQYKFRNFERETLSGSEHKQSDLFQQCPLTVGQGSEGRRFTPAVLPAISYSTCLIGFSNPFALCERIQKLSTSLSLNLLSTLSAKAYVNIMPVGNKIHRRSQYIQFRSLEAKHLGK